MVTERVGQAQTNGWKIFGITVICVAVLLLAFWLVKVFIFPNEFKPVVLSASETKTLNQKLNQLNLPALPASSTAFDQASMATDRPVQPLEPEAYSELNATREVVFTEKEINAMLAHNTDMANKLAIDLSDNLASAKMIVDLDPDMPLFGGKTLNLSTGLELAFGNGKPVVKLRGMSLWGVPMPNAWLGGIKNVDLVQEFGHSGGFWQAFADGIDYMQVSEGKLVVKLKE